MDKEEKITREYPKVLAVCISAWQEDSGTSTLPNLFRSWDPDKLSQIYTRSELPQTRITNDIFQIPEIQVVKRVLNPFAKAGGKVPSWQESKTASQAKNISAEDKGRKALHSANRNLLSLIRELVWSLGSWKTKELKAYVDNGDWDVVFCPIYPYIYMNRLQYWILKRKGLKGVAFSGDDNYAYKKGASLLENIHRYFLRRSIRKVMSRCRDSFVMIPKMQKEFDPLFGIKTQLLTKGIDFDKVAQPEFKIPSTPIKILYTGNLFYGRYLTLAKIVEVLKDMNKDGCVAELHVYSPNEITDEYRRLLDVEGCSYIHKPVPYTELQRILTDADVVTFVESLEDDYRYLARLSFSTKITDYFTSGKCILAVGAEDIAPIEYLVEKDAAIICTSYDEIGTQLRRIISNPELVTEYAKKAYDCGYHFHNAKDVDQLMFNVLSNNA